MFCPPCGAAAIYLLPEQALLRFISHRTGSPTKFGFLACGVYRVPLPLFPAGLRHCDTLRAAAMDLSLGFRSAVILADAWSYFLGQHNHYCHRRQCEHGLSSDTYVPAAASCVEYCLFAAVLKNLLFQTAQTFQNIHVAAGGQNRISIILRPCPAFNFDQFCTQ